MNNWVQAGELLVWLDCIVTFACGGILIISGLVAMGTSSAAVGVGAIGGGVFYLAVAKSYREFIRFASSGKKKPAKAAEKNDWTVN